MFNNVEVAKYFFEQTNIKYTPATLRKSIMQVGILIDSGFTKEEIIQGIDYCVTNTPPKGFTSLGWLSYKLSEILTKIKAQERKQQIQNTIIESDSYSIASIAKPTQAERVGNEYDFDLFKEEY